MTPLFASAYWNSFHDLNVVETRKFKADGTDSRISEFRRHHQQWTDDRMTIFICGTQNTDTGILTAKSVGPEEEKLPSDKNPNKTRAKTKRREASRGCMVDRKHTRKIIVARLVLSCFVLSLAIFVVVSTETTRDGGVKMPRPKNRNQGRKAHSVT